MSYGIMGSARNSYLLTYQTTRPIKALYFDGESAALMGLGQLDTQMLHVFGNISGPPNSGFPGLFGEYSRAAGLCDWLEASGLRGRGWGYEGIVRMNAGFEMIWCDFASPSLQLRTQLNVTAPRLPRKDGDDDDDDERGGGAPMPPHWRRDTGREPFLAEQAWGWYTSATDHYGRSRGGGSGSGSGFGEARVRARSCGALSYYSPRLVGLTSARAADEQALYNLTADGRWKGEGAHGDRSAALAQLARRRRYHHLEDVTTAEAALMRASSERVLHDLLGRPGAAGEEGGGCSGADWVYMTNEIIQSAGTHLQVLAGILDGARNATTMRTWMARLRSHSHAFYVAFLEYPAGYGHQASASEWDVDSPRYRTTLARCRQRYTQLLTPAPGDEDRLSPEEQDLRWAVEETYGAICSVLLTVGFQVEAGWAQDFQNRAPDADGENSSPAGDLEHHYGKLAASWADGVQQLLAWLGWEESFVGCAETCHWDERCFIPIWPFMSWGGFGGGGGGRRHPPLERNSTGPPHRPGPGEGHDGPPPGRGGDGPGRGEPGGDHPPPPGDGFPGAPGQKRPKGKMPAYMGNETELWSPRCVKADHILRGK
jgi:hypothetical protein